MTSPKRRKLNGKDKEVKHRVTVPCQLKKTVFPANLRQSVRKVREGKLPPPRLYCICIQSITSYHESQFVACTTKQDGVNSEFSVLQDADSLTGVYYLHGNLQYQSKVWAHLLIRRFLFISIIFYIVD